MAKTKIVVPIFISIIAVSIVAPYTVLKDVTSVIGSFTLWTIMTAVAIVISAYVLRGDDR